MQKQLTYWQKQRKERPSIKQLSEQFLNDDLRLQLEAFLQYTEKNKMTLSLCSCNTYENKFKGQIVFRIIIDVGDGCRKDKYSIKIFTVNHSHFSENKRDVIQKDLSDNFTRLKDDLSEYAVNHLSKCRGTCSCKPGIKLDIFGKSYKGVCCNDINFIRIDNPTETDYLKIKDLIDIRKQNIIDNAV